MASRGVASWTKGPVAHETTGAPILLRTFFKGSEVMSWRTNHTGRKNLIGQLWKTATLHRCGSVSNCRPQRHSWCLHRWTTSWGQRFLQYLASMPGCNCHGQLNLKFVSSMKTKCLHCQFYFNRSYSQNEILTVRFLVASTRTRTSELLGFAASRISNQQRLVVTRQDVLDFLLRRLVNVFLVVGNQRLGESLTDGYENKRSA